MSRPGPVSAAALERFLERVRLQPNGCWTITDSAADRYSSIMLEDGTSKLGHRFAYEFLIGPIPDGLQLDHLCRKPHCVNPDHLEPVEPRENYLRGVSPLAENARKTHCQRGHALNGDNVYSHPKRPHVRDCRECRRDAVRRYRARRTT